MSDDAVGLPIIPFLESSLWSTEPDTILVKCKHSMVTQGHDCTLLLHSRC